MTSEEEMQEIQTLFQFPKLQNYRKTGGSLSFLPSLKQNQIIQSKRNIKPLLSIEASAILPHVNFSKLPVDTLSEAISHRRICVKICDWFSKWKTSQQLLFMSRLVDRCSENLLEQLTSTLEPVFHRDFKTQLIHNRSKSNPLPDVTESKSHSAKSGTKCRSDISSHSNWTNSTGTLRNSLRSYDFQNSDYWTNEKYSSHSISRLLNKRLTKSMQLQISINPENYAGSIISNDEFKEQVKNIFKRINNWSEGKTEVLIINITKEASPDVLLYLADRVHQRLNHQIHINCLPDKVLLTVFSSLDPQNICHCAQVCQRWRYLTKDSMLWHMKCEEFADEMAAPELIDTIEESARLQEVVVDWKLAYQEITNLAKNNLIATDSNNISRSSLFIEHGGFKFLEDIRTTIERDYRPTAITIEHEFDEQSAFGSYKDVGNDYYEDTREHEDDYYDQDSLLSHYSISLGTAAKVAFLASKLAHGQNAIRAGIVRPLKRIRRLQGHLEAVTCFQFDKCKIISGSVDRTLRLWDIRSGRLVRTLLYEHKGGVRCLQYDDRIIVTGSWDATVRVWDIVQYTTIAVMYKHRDCVSCLQFVEKKLVTGSHDSKVCIWDMNNWECIDIFDRHDGPVNCLNFDGTMVLSGSSDRTLLYWNITTLECIHQFVGHQDAILCLEVKNGLVASGSADGKVLFWNLNLACREAAVPVHEVPVRAVRFMGLRFFAGLDDGSIKEFDLRTGIYIRTLSGHFGPIQCIQIQQTRMLSSSDDGSIRVWDMKPARIQVGDKSYPHLLKKIVIPPNIIREDLLQLQC